MRIATYNINGIKARLPRLLEWLDETRPDIACLQEIKTQDEGFPAAEFERLGYGAIWHGQKGFNGVAILARDAQPVETGRGLEGDPEDVHSRYLEAEVFGLRVASIYLPNGNPQPGPKFDYKLNWMKRLRARAQQLLALEIP
ncbi:MAG: exodeoxyribonuclease, partial [Pseudomonadota bacterium]